MRIVLYGLGNNFAKIYRYLIDNKNHEIVGIFDKRKKHIEVDGKEIYAKSINELDMGDYYDLIIITSEKYYWEI